MSTFRRRLAALGTVCVAVTAVALSTAAPAQAATGWKPYGNNNPTTVESGLEWTCGSTATVGTNLYAQVCVARDRSATIYAQAAVIVRNNNSTTITGTATASLYINGESNSKAYLTCPASGIAAKSWSVCYSDRVYTGAKTLLGKGYANGVYLPQAYDGWY